MIFEQYYLGCLAHASYLIADEGTRKAAVVDPQRDIDQYLAFASEHDLAIEYVLLTHFHADFVSGHLELAKRTGAKIVLSAKGETEFDSIGLEDGDEIALGSVRIEGLQTPGHTPESMTFLVFDGENERPWAALTGDTLFIGDVGRPDLLASIGFEQADLAAMLYDSLHDKLMLLPDETLVYPAHGAGSMCGKALSDEKVSTIGKQRAENYALQPMEKQAFIELVSSGQQDAPKYFVHDAILNRKQHATLDETLERGLRALALQDFQRMSNAGAVVVDVRDAAEFAARHLAGSLGIGLDGKFATWAGYVIDADSPILLVGSREQVEEAATRLGRIGLDRVVGYLDRDVSDISDLGSLQRFERYCPNTLRTALESGTGPKLLDVRTAGEFESGHVDGAVNIPLNRLEERLEEVPQGPLVVICRSGYRSILGASILQANGIDAVSDLEGGMLAWEGATCTASS